MRIRVDRCVCSAVSFAQLKSVADRNQITTLEELYRHQRFGENCKRCHPYIRKMLKNGDTVFHELIDPQDKK